MNGTYEDNRMLNIINRLNESEEIKTDDNAPKVANCSECGAVLDIDPNKIDEMDGATEVVCPVCHNTVKPIITDDKFVMLMPQMTLTKYESEGDDQVVETEVPELTEEEEAKIVEEIKDDLEEYVKMVECGDTEGAKKYLEENDLQITKVDEIDSSNDDIKESVKVFEGKKIVECDGVQVVKSAKKGFVTEDEDDDKSESTIKRKSGFKNLTPAQKRALAKNLKKARKKAAMKLKRTKARRNESFKRVSAKRESMAITWKKFGPLAESVNNVLRANGYKSKRILIEALSLLEALDQDAVLARIIEKFSDLGFDVKATDAVITSNDDGTVIVDLTLTDVDGEYYLDEIETDLTKTLGTKVTITDPVYMDDAATKCRMKITVAPEVLPANESEDDLEEDEDDEIQEKFRRSRVTTVTEDEDDLDEDEDDLDEDEEMDEDEFDKDLVEDEDDLDEDEDELDEDEDELDEDEDEDELDEDEDDDKVSESYKRRARKAKRMLESFTGGRSNIRGRITPKAMRKGQIIYDADDKTTFRIMESTSKAFRIRVLKSAKRSLNESVGTSVKVRLPKNGRYYLLKSNPTK